MKRVIVPDSFNSSAKTITLPAEFTSLTAKQIESIFNASRGNWLYNTKSTKYNGNTGPGKKFYPLASVSGGVITYTASNFQGTTNDDLLIIVVDDESTPVNVTVKSTTGLAVGAAALITSSIAFTSNENLTTEKQTAALTLPSRSPSGNYRLTVLKPIENTAGDLTLTIYDQVEVDGSNVSNANVATLTTEMITGAATCRGYTLQGIGVGEGKIVVGAKFAADSGAVTVYFTLHAV